MESALKDTLRARLKASKKALRTGVFGGSNGRMNSALQEKG